MPVSVICSIDKHLSQLLHGLNAEIVTESIRLSSFFNSFDEIERTLCKSLKLNLAWKAKSL